MVYILLYSSKYLRPINFVISVIELANIFMKINPISTHASSQEIIVLCSGLCVFLFIVVSVSPTSISTTSYLLSSTSSVPISTPIVLISSRIGSFIVDSVSPTSISTTSYLLSSTSSVPISTHIVSVAIGSTIVVLTIIVVIVVVGVLLYYYKRRKTMYVNHL